MKLFWLLAILIFASCNNDNSATNSPDSSIDSANAETLSNHWQGVFTNGMKETYITFNVSEDGTMLTDLTFNGYWHCDGSLTQDILGPEKGFEIKGDSVNGVVSEPENAGATSTHYELKAKFNGNSATGTFRMNINALNCDTRLLTWEARRS